MSNEYKNKNWLYQKYVLEGLGSNSIARLCGMGPTTIWNWLIKFGLTKELRNSKCCRRKGCKQVKAIGADWGYCWKHFRLQCMVKTSHHRYKDKVSVSQLETLLSTIEPDLICNGCSRKMIWHKSFGTSSQVISLQHEKDKSLSFLCVGCNSRDRNFTCNDWRSIPADQKWCPLCCKIKSKLCFGLRRRNKDSLHEYCKDCVSIKNSHRL